MASAMDEIKKFKAQLMQGKLTAGDQKKLHKLLEKLEAESDGPGERPGAGCW